MNELLAGLSTRELSGGDIEVADYARLPAAPLVSVDMITYNHAAYIREALDSVLMQQVDFPYEICLGEDGSTDGTREICIEYARKHPDKFRLFLRDRSNPARAGYKVPFMHNGVETFDSCRGKYIATLEGDDYWTCRGKLMAQLCVLEERPHLSLCAHYAIAFDQALPWRVSAIPPTPLRDFDIKYELENCFFLATGSLVFRREQLDLDAFRSAWAGDSMLIMQHLRHGNGIVLPKIMSMYRQHSAGASRGGAGYHPYTANLDQWTLFRSLVSPQHIVSVNHGYAKQLCWYVDEERRRWRICAALSLWWRLLLLARPNYGLPALTWLRLAMAATMTMISPTGLKMIRRVSERTARARERAKSFFA